MNIKKAGIVQLVFELLKDSQYFLKEAEKHQSNEMLQQRFIRASIISAWSGFEGWINKTCSDFAKTIPNLGIHGIGFLLEKRIELKKGQFELTNSDKYESIENKMEYLLRRFANYTLDKSTKSWKNFVQAKIIRDSIAHPKEGRGTVYSLSDGILTIDTLRQFLNLLSKRIYRSNRTF